MKHELPRFPYALDAFAPILSAETMDFHRNKHHAGYFTQLNQWLETPEYAHFKHLDLASLVKKAPLGPLFNNAGQAWNHNFFWDCLTPVRSENQCPSDLEAAIEKAFGSLAAFKTQFITASVKQFGSGWAWLIKDAQGQLSIETTSNADTPLRHDKTCLLTCDVWEHAYYIDYRNRRPDYVNAFWDIANWKFVHQNFIS